MNDSKKLFWPSAMVHGLFLGIALVMYSIIVYVSGKYFAKGASSFSYLILIGGIVWAQLSFRKNQENGVLTYGTALGYGTVVVFFSSILSAIYTLILLRYLDHNLISQLKTIQEQALLDEGFTPDMVEQQMTIASKYVFTPEFLSGSSIFSFTLMGFVLSLITSIFTKKSFPNDFVHAMDNTSNELEKKDENIVPETKIEDNRNQSQEK